ncbi:hypothetical protein BHQ31_17860 [Burkholderia cenocepacia]|nr:hypothetical protein BHQ31_17860 [Burkholderia cenocepacia]
MLKSTEPHIAQRRIATDDGHASDSEKVLNGIDETRNDGAALPAATDLRGRGDAVASALR